MFIQVVFGEVVELLFGEVLVGVDDQARVVRPAWFGVYYFGKHMIEDVLLTIQIVSLLGASMLRLVQEGGSAGLESNTRILQGELCIRLERTKKDDRVCQLRLRLDLTRNDRVVSKVKQVFEVEGDVDQEENQKSKPGCDVNQSRKENFRTLLKRSKQWLW